MVVFHALLHGYGGRDAAHSITSSARASSVGGKLRANALAVE
jgi:hypothetical protein